MALIPSEFVAFRDIMTRIVTTGATPGRPASSNQIDAAELRLGIHFDTLYKNFMSHCNGFEGLHNWVLYPLEELGASARWLERTGQFESRRIDLRSFLPRYEFSDDVVIDPVFPLTPPGRAHVVIGEHETRPGALIAAFPITGLAATTEIAYHHWDKEFSGDLLHVLRLLTQRNEQPSDDNHRDESAQVHSQVGRLLRGIDTGSSPLIRHTLSHRWRTEFDHFPLQAINQLRQGIWYHGAAPVLDYCGIEFDLQDSRRQSLTATALFHPATGQAPHEVRVGVVSEHSIWRIDSWEWAA
ncbi:SMI1/KNR4 family protein [Nocardia yamanashiensis]|uniref:SMI1/KNR4 family protein n=1 Tax=Nocardia yamanashiensis TaxID=209247 RepID=UPI000A508DC6|nr:SMI1/KNR4 family protein [Nocardia yamanashiensis]